MFPTINGYEQLQNLIIKATQTVLLPKVEENKQELGESVLAQLLGEEVVPKPSKKLAKEDVFLSKIFHGFTEIDSSLRTLQDIEVYIRSFPYRSNSLTRSRHLRYHLENHYNEIYIFRERLKQYLVIIARCYRGDTRHAAILRKTEILSATIDQILNRIITVRGRHVHVVRIEDHDLKRLELFDLLHSTELSEMSDLLEDYYKKFVYKQVRRDLKGRVKSIND